MPIRFSDNPRLCACGCKNETKWSQTNRRWNKFIKNHHTRGYKHSEKTCQIRSERMKGDKNPAKNLVTREKMSLAKKGKYLMEKNPAWKGGFYTDKNGRKVINLGNGKEIFQSRLIAEKVLERSLTSKEIVHHIDLNKSNDANNNLLICTKSYHLFLHKRINPNNYKCTGFKQSEETKTKRAKSNNKSVVVKGVKYSSVKEAIKNSGISDFIIRKRIQTKTEGFFFFKGEE